jgi:hypothetical protein
VEQKWRLWLIWLSIGFLVLATVPLFFLILGFGQLRQEGAFAAGLLMALALVALAGAGREEEAFRRRQRGKGRPR